VSAHPPLRLRKLAPTAQHAASAGTQRSRSAGERTPKSLSWPCASARSRVSVSVSPCSNRNSTCTCSARNKRPTHCTSHQGQAGRHGHGTAAQTQPTARLPGRPAGRACGGAPFGPVTCVALVRPSSPDSMKNSTCSPSARLRKPSVMMLVCGPRWLLSGPCGCRPAAAWALYRHALRPWGATGRATTCAVGRALTWCTNRSSPPSSGVMNLCAHRLSAPQAAKHKQSSAAQKAARCACSERHRLCAHPKPFVELNLRSPHRPASGRLRKPPVRQTLPLSPCNAAQGARLPTRRGAHHLTVPATLPPCAQTTADRNARSGWRVARGRGRRTDGPALSRVAAAADLRNADIRLIRLPRHCS